MTCPCPVVTLTTAKHAAIKHQCGFIPSYLVCRIPTSSAVPYRPCCDVAAPLQERGILVSQFHQHSLCYRLGPVADMLMDEGLI